MNRIRLLPTAALLGVVCLGACLGAWLVPPAAAQSRPSFSDGAIRIGVLNDQAGPTSDVTGAGSVAAARLAVEEFGGAIDGAPIEILVGDHQIKPDVGVTIVRRWLDTDRVDAVTDVASSGVGLAVNDLMAERGKVFLNTSASADFTGKACKPLSVQWNYNTSANTNAIVAAVMADGRHDTWFIVGPDYAFGHAQAAGVRQAVEARGGRVLGTLFHPAAGGSDFSSYLLQAQSSGATVIALANSANDFVNTVKQAREFGIGVPGGPQLLLAVSAVNLPEIVALGLPVVQDLLFLSTFEWDRTAASRAWTDRFVARTGRLPSQNQAAVYSAVRHYLQAVKDARTDDAATVVAAMRATPVRDAFADDGHLRADGQMVHDLFLVRAKKPAESTRSGDFFHLVRTLSGADAFLPLERSACPLVRK